MGINSENKAASFEFETRRAGIQRVFSPMVKIVGPVCNLDCSYCYYMEKDALYPDKQYRLSAFTMRDDVLEKLIKDYMASQPADTIEFIWHGGEPTMAGLDYFRKIIELERKYAGGRKVSNVLQTNGTLINDDWAEFLALNGFLCGLSIDGPQKFHDRHRTDTNGKGSWERVVRCAGLFKKHGVEFNTMTVINASNSREPVAVYRFLKELGSRYVQFTPIVERIAEDESEPMSIVGIDYAKASAVMDDNVTAEAWGNFLCRVFDEWVRRDVGHIFVNWFDNTLSGHMGMNPSLCTMAEYCGCAPAVEHNGDVYCCDHFVFGEYLSGNIMETGIADLVKNDRQLFFEQNKKDKLPLRCRECEFLRLCGGDCPKHRFGTTDAGEPVSVLCEGFRKFFGHSRKHFEFMASELRNQRPASCVMKAGIK